MKEGSGLIGRGMALALAFGAVLGTVVYVITEVVW